jgi:microcystin-dependent protein
MTLAQLPAHNHTATFTPAGGGAAAAVAVSTSNGTHSVPAMGDYLGVPTAGPSQTKAYTNSPGTTVALGGVSGGGGGGGTVTVNPNGTGQPMPILNPVLALNLSICTNGLYPVRP